MRHAQFERLEDGTIFGSIPGFQGVWADAPTEHECRAELREVLEGWILLGMANHDELAKLTEEGIPTKGIPTTGKRLRFRTLALLSCKAIGNPA